MGQRTCLAGEPSGYSATACSPSVGWWGPPRWEWDLAVNTRIRIRCISSYGMDPADADHWKARTVGIDGASREAIEAYIKELDARIAQMSRQLQKDRKQTFREKVRKAVRDGKHRLITGWVGEGASPPISVVLTEEGKHLVQPMEVAAAFAKEWGALWRPPPP